MRYSFVNAVVSKQLHCKAIESCYLPTRTIHATTCLDAKNRNYYIRHGSIGNALSEEVRHLISNQRHALNIDEWNKQEGIQDKVVYDMQNKDDFDDDQTPNIEYHPHKDEKFSKRSAKYKPSPLLLVKRVKNFVGEPFWNRNICLRLGIGEYCDPDKMVVVPNIPTICLKLYAVKHLIEIVPLQFPDGVPSNDEFDPSACRIDERGRFLYTKKINQEQVSTNVENEEDLMERKTREEKMKKMFPVEFANVMKRRKADPLEKRMLITREMMHEEAIRHWYKPIFSPLGNSNYHRKLKNDHPHMFDRVHDTKFKRRFS